MRRHAALLLLALGAPCRGASFANMNGEYLTTPTPGCAKGAASCKQGNFSTSFAQYPGGVEYFEISLGPMQTLYSQVWWKTLPSLPLPAELVKRFDGKAMAVVGYETDSVRKTPQGDVSVPINMAYNHHHDVFLTGKHSSMQKVRYDPADLTIPPMMRGDAEFLELPVEHSPSPLDLPTSLHLADGNGGEYRKSYHGFPSPVAYVLDSPDSVHVNPMFIDTWHREAMNISGGSPFVAGPLPKHSLSPANAAYSGLLECPLTDKIEKVLPGGYSGYNSTFPRKLFQCKSEATYTHLSGSLTRGHDVIPPLNLTLAAAKRKCSSLAACAGITFKSATPEPSGVVQAYFKSAASLPPGGGPWQTFLREGGRTSCPHAIGSPKDCFAAAQASVPKGVTVTGSQGSSTTRAPGCSMAFDGAGGATAFFNTLTPSACNLTATFANGDKLVGSLESPTSLVWTHFGKPSDTHTWTRATSSDSCLGKWQAGGDAVISATAITGPANGWFPAAVTAYTPAGVAVPSQQCCGAGVTQLTGETQSLIGMKLAISNNATMTITLTGPAAVWFGVGFFAQAMEDKPYAIIIDGGSGKVSERVLASHMGTVTSPAGTLLAPSLKIISSSVTNGKRTVVLTRPLLGASPQHANFTLQDVEIPYINAIGSSPNLTYHVKKTAASISLWPSGGDSAAQPVCLCEQPAAPYGQATGQIKYKPTGEQFGFINGCSPEPRESILASRNPTCDVRAYTGGLQVCKHMWSLLDTEQGQPWADQPLVFFQKYRFYFQEYNPKHHVVVLPRAVWAIGAFIGEYDVPQCAAGTPVEDCTHEIWGVVKAGGDNLHFAAMHFHCHAPTCLAMEIVNNQTGELICRQDPVYGGSGQSEPKYDEAGYILQPPCLWGDEPGLEPMPLASGVTFTVRAITNSTYGHHGEMAFPEINLVPWNTTTDTARVGFSAHKETVKTEWTLLEFNGQSGGR